MPIATKTDGTLWSWGDAKYGMLGHSENNNTHLSSPKQIPGTTWRTISANANYVSATKTDGTLWSWGNNGGNIQQDEVARSSPTQVGTSTDYTDAVAMSGGIAALLTDDTP